jgi:DNA polymerase-3 subunit epsilon
MPATLERNSEMSELKLDRPLAFFDIEATGISPRADRIIDLAIVTLNPDGTRDTHTFRVNPEMPIPEESTKIHGITDQDVENSPTFKEVAPEINSVLEGCDLGGYNIVRFDIPMLAEEFIRCGIKFDVDSRRLIDAQRIFHRREPRDLTAALSFYCGELHMGAHGAEADVLATIQVLEGQFAKYQDLPGEMDSLHDYCNPRDPSWVDRQGRLKWSGGKVALNFGKKKGQLLRRIVEEDPGFIKWMLRSDFPADTRQIVQDAMQGIWPEPPKSSD